MIPPDAGQLGKFAFACAFAVALSAGRLNAQPSVQAKAAPKASQATPAPVVPRFVIADAAQGSGASQDQTLTPEQLKALTKQTQNPVGNVAVMPFQNNWNYGAGQTKATIWNLNLQPVIPLMLKPNLNLIERAIVPMINQPPLVPQTTCLEHGVVSVPPCGAQLGIGNIQLQSYFAPKTNPNGFIWGAGPLIQFPTVTQSLGTQQWGGGVNAVGLVMPGSWVIGALVSQEWHIAGPSAGAGQQNINMFLTQPFINYNFGRGWALSEAPIITANWSAPGNQKWTVPIGLGIGNTNTWLKLPMSYQVAYYGNVTHPNGAPNGLFRFSWSIIWPVKRGLSLPGQ